MKYIDADKLKAEIERQMKFYNEKEMKAWDDSEQGDEDALWYQGHRKMCAKLLTFIDTLSEEPDKSLVEEVKRYYSDNFAYISSDQPTLSILTNVARHFAEWQKEQFERNRLAHCDALSKEDYERETDFAMEIIEKEHRQPTFTDAINYGMRLQKQQMMKGAVEGEVENGTFGIVYLRKNLTNDGYSTGDKVKLIVVKEENK